MPESIAVAGMPIDLVPSDASAWSVDPAGDRVHGTAAPRSDFFVDPAGTGAPAHNAVTLLGPAPDGDFQFSARVTVDFADMYDAGVLMLWCDEANWAKLCFEYSPDGEAMIVSVINRDVSDDANAFVVDGGAAWLRVSRIGRAFAYHASLDGQRWQLVRNFALAPTAAPVRVGFEAQAPVGEGCAVTFSDIRFTATSLTALRDGS
ncbi:MULTISPECIES: DUF1349 domain-containing protein [Microbacterium]|uniref:DUF1349 domain-containing protein n=1 Tax=Microbacterium wangchenii TaxID=2541726 RepID=A0ABX5SW83_9MICO|nr:MULTISPECIES: DUF1349 domain-containing protein [Microbacterium]MCK6066201.1 DUF1349 domain-containing protein [Microbacterium sp. EYE_512]QBR90473.1 DUF1349 domain-containing protein [Microbacterium wangchenii]TXK14499.1 DUF1349 domain-containing protein [Microbacterium wangchenii]